MANQKHKIHVYKDSDGEFRVFPPVLVMQGSPRRANTDEVELINHTDEDLFWTVPAGVFDPAAGHAEKIDKGLTSAAAKKARNASVAANYVVFMTGSGKKAKGNSDPVLIIEV